MSISTNKDIMRNSTRSKNDIRKSMKVNDTEHSFASRLSDLVDQLHTLRYLNEAIHMAASDNTVATSATNALQALCNEVNRKIESIEEQIEEMREEIQC